MRIAELPRLVLALIFNWPSLWAALEDFLPGLVGQDGIKDNPAFGAAEGLWALQLGARGSWLALQPDQVIAAVLAEDAHPLHMPERELAVVVPRANESDHAKRSSRYDDPRCDWPEVFTGKEVHTQV